MAEIDERYEELRGWNDGLQRQVARLIGERDELQRQLTYMREYKDNLWDVIRTHSKVLVQVKGERDELQRQLDGLRAELQTNARLLARQCDLAREAEMQAADEALAEKVRRLEDVAKTANILMDEIRSSGLLTDAIVTNTAEMELIALNDALTWLDQLRPLSEEGAE